MQVDMTNKEYLTKSLNGMNLSDDDIEIIMLKGGIDADATASAEQCDVAVYNRFSVVLKGAMQNVSEGGMSISWNIEAMTMYYNALCNEYGKENLLATRPKIRNRSNMW